MFCTQCGTAFDAYSTACLQCGKPRVAMPPPLPASSAGTDPALRWLLPVGRSGFAIAAGYLALLSMVPVLGQLALAFGLLALRDIGRHPEKGGRGRAWFGVIAGGFFTAILVVMLATSGR
jgi:hypothetical protein